MLALRAALAAVAPEVPPPPGEPRLEWVAPPQCPDAARGAEHLARFLGGRGLSAPARVELAASTPGHVATVTVDGATRTLHAEDCETLARAAALVVAVSLDPLATAAVGLEDERGELEPPRGRAGEVGPTAEREPSRSRRRSDETAPSSPARRRTTWGRADMPPRADPRSSQHDRHFLGASGGIALALVPSLTGAVRLGYAFERDVLRLQAHATYATPRTVVYPTEPTVGGRFQSVALGVQACFAPSTRRIGVPLCGGVEGGPIVGQGLGVTNPRSPVGAWIGALASGSVIVRLSPRLALTAGADVLVSLRRPAFHVGARETLFRVPPAGLRALAGLELRLR